MREEEKRRDVVAVRYCNGKKSKYSEPVVCTEGVNENIYIYIYKGEL